MNVVKNEETAEIVGLCFGDGSLTRRHSGKNKDKLRFQLRGHITEDREHYDNYIIPLFTKNIGIVPTTVYRGKKPYYGIATENHKICDNLKILGIPIGIKKELKIPQWILNDKKYMRGFLRGFVDTDGSVSCGKDYNYPHKGHIKIRINIGSTSHNLIKEISQMLTSFGIKNLVIAPYKRKMKNWSDLSRVQVEGQNVVKYFGLIGSKNPKHKTKFEVWKRQGFCPPYTTLEHRRKILKGNIEPISYKMRECQSGQMG